MTEAFASGGRPVRRPVLISMMALGAVVSLATVSGVFAVFTDRATTGQNSASSRGEAASADLQIAAGTLNTTSGATTCGAYSEDLSTGIISATDMAPFVGLIQVSVCLKNVGSRDIDLTTAVIELTDTDTGCTGDENALDSASCGVGVGELSSNLRVVPFWGDCTSFGTSLGEPTVAELASTPLATATLSVGEVGCVYFEVIDVAVGDDVTISQSDTTTWKFAFDATAV